MGTRHKQPKYKSGAHLARIPGRAGWYIRWTEPRGQILVIPYTPAASDPLLDLRKGADGCIVESKPPANHPLHRQIESGDTLTHAGEQRIHTPADMARVIAQYAGQHIGIRARRGKSGTTSRWKKAGETREEAEISLGQFLVNRDRVKEGLQPIMAPAGFTFQQLVDETVGWIGSPLSGYSPATIYVFTYMVRKLGRQWGHMPLVDFTPGWMNKWSATRGTEVSSSALGNHIKVWRVAFKLALARQYITADPTTGLTIPKARAARPKYLTKEQIDLLLECASASDTQRLDPAPFLKGLCVTAVPTSIMRKWYNTNGTFDTARARFLLLTGLRKNQLTSLTWQQYDPKRGAIVLESRPDHTEKSKRVNVIPLPREAREIIAGQPAGSKYIFPNLRGERDQTIEYRFRKIAARVKERGGGHIHLHLLRHTALTALLRHTHDIAAVQRYAGHSDVKTTARYAWVLDDELKAMTEDFNPMQIAGTAGKGDA